MLSKGRSVTATFLYHTTYKAACLALGLLENDDQWKYALEDAALAQSPSKMRALFAIIIVFCIPSDPQSLWEQFQRHFCEDLLYRERTRLHDPQLDFSDEIFNRGLIEIEDKVVCLSEKYLVDFGMTSPNRENLNYDPLELSIRQSYDIHQLKEFVQVNITKLVDDQKHAFDAIVDSVINNKGKIFFLDAPGGTGKMFLINLLLYQSIICNYDQ